MIDTPEFSESRSRTVTEGLLHYLSFFLKHRYLIIIPTIVAAVGSVAFSIVSLILPPEKSPLPNYYAANALLLIQDESSGAGSVSSMLASFGFAAPSGSGAMNFAEVAQEIARSRTFVDSIATEFRFVDHYDIEEKFLTNSRSIYNGNLMLQYNRVTSSLRISYEDKDPVFAMNVTNHIVALLDDWFAEWEGSSNQRKVRLIEDKLTEVSAEIAVLEKKVQEFQRTYGVLAIEDLALSRSQVVADLQTQIVQVEIEIKNYSLFSTIEDVALTRLKAQRANLLELISQIEDGYTGGEERLPALDELPGLALEFGRIKTDLEIQMRVYQTLSEQYEIAKLSISETPVFDILEYAEVPEEKSRPSRARLCMIATLIGFAFGISLAIIQQWLRDIKADPKKAALLNGGSES